MAETEPKKGGLGGCGALLIVVVGFPVAFFLFAAVYGALTPDTAKPPEETITRPNGDRLGWADAYIACRDSVEKRLRAPSTARFVRAGSNDFVEPNKVGNTFITTIIVDAENGFGAMIRSRWSCIIDGTADTLKVAEM